MAFTKIDIGNQALSMVGSPAIASFEDGSAEGEALTNAYEMVVGTALTAPGGAPMRWSFATTQEALTKLAAAPLARFAFAYQAPPAMLRIHSLTQNSAVLRFGVQGDQIQCDEDNATTPVILDYTFRAQEETWPPDFAGCVAHELAARLALSLNENRGLANTLAATVRWQGARTADSQGRSSPRLRATRLINARFSGRGSRW
jgi:hypothetical protein